MISHQRHYSLLSKIYLSFLILILGTLSLNAQQTCCDMPDWQYVKEIAIDNKYAGNSAHTGYQVLLSIDTKSLIDQSKMNVDGSDIRFTDSKCLPLLDYWIEKGINTVTTEMWVKVPSLPADTVITLYMYYGNSVATATSNFNATFPNATTITGQVTLTGIQNYDWLDIQAGSVVTLLSGSFFKINARKVLVSGTINGDNMGYGPQLGPGAGKNGNSGKGGGGGSYGGQGGSGGGASTGGPIYGTLDGPDIDLGSGGGGSDCAGASGGGGMKISAASIEMNGTISMKGGSAGNCSQEAGGGGAGGGVLFEADRISGIGSINVSGGKGGKSNSKEGGGGGAGGRVKKRFTQTNTFSGTVNMSGGLNGSGGQGGMTPGAVGTDTSLQIPGLQFTLGAEKPIRVAPVADFSFLGACPGEVVVFTNLSTIGAGVSISQYDWDFGDTNTDNVKDPSHTYQSSAVFDVVLKATSNEGCTDDTTIKVSMDPFPIAGFYSDSVCLNSAPTQFTDTTKISAGSIVKWGWNFGDGFVSGDQNPQHIFFTDGNHTIKLIVESDKGCKDTIYNEAVIHPLPVAKFSVDSVCFGDITTVVNMSTVKTGLISQTNSVVYFGDGQSASLNSDQATYTYPVVGDYDVLFIAKSDKGCTDQTTLKTVTYAIPIATFGSTPACVNQPAQFTDLTSGGIVKWDWDFGDGSASKSKDTFHAFTTAGNQPVKLTVTEGIGCTDDTTIQVPVFPLPIVNFSSDVIDGCAPLGVNFMDNSTTTSGIIDEWVWLANNTISSLKNPVINFSGEGTYDVILVVKSSDGCRDTIIQSKYITVYPTPEADFFYSPELPTVLNASVRFSDISQGAISGWRWNFYDLDTLSLMDQFFDSSPNYIFPSDTGYYPVRLIATNTDGCNDTITKYVFVEPDVAVFVPTAFTPNDDGSNDYFFPQGLGISPDNDFTFRIFDRWGDVVFQSQNIKDQWDGSLPRGVGVAPQGSYSWKLEVRDLTSKSKKHLYSGIVTLLP